MAILVSCHIFFVILQPNTLNALNNNEFYK